MIASLLEASVICMETNKIPSVAVPVQIWGNVKEEAESVAVSVLSRAIAIVIR
jgi:hypothetical protein